MIGNVTVEYALSTFAEGSGPGARVAAVALSNMKRDRQ
jgi:conjugal transfer pilus assembly protein TrbC